jgi:hypothetical protein
MNTTDRDRLADALREELDPIFRDALEDQFEDADELNAAVEAELQRMVANAFESWEADEEEGAA